MADVKHVEAARSLEQTPALVWDIAAHAAAQRLQPSSQGQVLDRLDEIADLLRAIEKNTRFREQF